jgi:hypothetical protein
MKTVFASLILLFVMISCTKENLQEIAQPVPQEEIKKTTDTDGTCEYKYQMCIQSAFAIKEKAYAKAEFYGSLGSASYLYTGSAIATVENADNMFYESCLKCQTEYLRCKGVSSW